MHRTPSPIGQTKIRTRGPIIKRANICKILIRIPYKTPQHPRLLLTPPQLNGFKKLK